MRQKILSTIALGLFITTTSFAQEQSNTEQKASYISLGPVAGFGHSWISNNVNEFKPSANIGAAILYSKDENWGFGGLITASHEGYAEDIFVNRNTYRNYYDPTYIRATPRVYYFFGDYGNRVRPKVYAGPSVAYMVAEDDYFNQPVRAGETIRWSILQPRYNSNWDFGINAGAGVNIQVAPRTWLNLDGDYYHGLLNVTTEDGKNRSLRANVGVMFGI